MPLRRAIALLSLGLSLVAAAPARALDDPSPTPAPVARASDTLAPLQLLDQRGERVSLPDGNLWVVTFFYGHCPDVCPLLLYNLQTLEARLPPDLREHVRFGAVSFDPGRDTPAVMPTIASNYGYRARNEYMLTGDAPLLAAMEKSFRFDFRPDGHGGYKHVSLLALMDGDGRVVKHYYGLQPDYDAIEDAIVKLLR